jgi:hypothetical protein
MLQPRQFAAAGGSSAHKRPICDGTGLMGMDMAWGSAAFGKAFRIEATSKNSAFA